MLTTVITHATGDVFPASDWNTYIRDNLNYLVAAGADVASANSIAITNDFHGITGTTTIQTITYTGVVAGQEISLWIKNGPLTLDGHTGNIRLASGDRTVFPNEVIRLVYDGANWREQGKAGLCAFGSRAAAVSTTGSTFAAGADILASAISYYADGAGTYLVTASAPGWRNNTTPGANSLFLNLDGASSAIMAQTNWSTGSTNFDSAMNGTALITPAAGVHTVNARLASASGGGTAAIDAGASGAGYAPIIVKIERVA